MDLQDRVTSLELSRWLKNLGVKQESLFYWWIYENWHLDYKENVPADNNNYVSAYTVAELGEALPKNAYTRKTKQGYCAYLVSNGSAYKIERKTEADARGELLCYLIENKSITP